MCKIVFLFPMPNKCAGFAQDCTSIPSVQSMWKICGRLYFFLQCTIYVQDLHEIVLLSQMWIYAQDLQKIVLLSLMLNICARFAQDCTYFPNAQYMRKNCERLYFFLRCTIYGQDLHKIVLLSPMCNICTRFAQDFTSFSNVQYMHKIVMLSPMWNICGRFGEDCRSFSIVQFMHYILISSMCNICTRLA